ncbi:MAG: hypothetical protein K6F40_10830 [Bacteroidales bacterium]|nr:hypothetical protein [Bacteroidales bacterium]
MRRQKLFMRTMLILALVGVSMVSFAQKEKKAKKTREKDNTFWLDLSAGVGSTTHYDNSIAPFSFQGAQTPLTFGFTDEWKRCHIHFDVSYIRTNISKFSGKMTAIEPNLEFLYSCLKPSDSRWHLWAGASTEVYMELMQLPELGNAAITTSIFGNLDVVGKVACDFAYSKKDNTHPWMTAYFKLALPLFTSASRPGFAYVRDPMNNDNLLGTLLAPNVGLFKMFPGCTTDLGLSVNLRNKNRILFGYRWDYLTTGKKGVYRYDNAFHTFYVSFMFNI